MRIVWYVTPHGFGHLARSCDILRALLARRPDARAVIAGHPPPDFVRARLTDERVSLRRAILDAGFQQHDAVRGDVAASLAAALDLVRHRESLVREETRFLREAEASLAVSDIPSIPFEAAAAAGIPCAAVGNFGWDWIYAELSGGDARFEPVIRMYREGYARADWLLRLPFHEEMTAFARRRDIPVVAKPGRNRRAEIARAARCDPAARWALVGLTSVQWDDAALDRLERLTDTVFLTSSPLAFARANFRALDRRHFPFSDLLASADVVIGKPGHALISECVVNAKPMVCVERPDFPETQVLLPAIRRHLRHAFVSQSQFYAGDLADALTQAVHDNSTVEPIAAGGAEVAADFLLALAENRPPASAPLA